MYIVQINIIIHIEKKINTMYCKSGVCSMNKKIYVVTRANGHLGSTIIRMLDSAGCEVRGFVLPGASYENSENVKYYEGDVRDIGSLRSLLEGTEDNQTVFIHTAGIVDISDDVTDKLYDVNVNGTRNVVDVCIEKGVDRLVYVSSVHAIPEGGEFDVLHEVNSFSPDKVTGGYAKTKAEATQIVLDAVKRGLDAVVVHPSGILGPYDRQGNHLVQLVSDYIRGKLPACVNGGYDFVDVRDVASGCLVAAGRGRRGECYILSNRHYEVREILKMVRGTFGGRKLPILPMWLVRAVEPAIGFVSKLRKKRPLFTKYSLYTLKSNDRFSHDKATSELGYRPRDLLITIRDTVIWLKKYAGKKATA